MADAITHVVTMTPTGSASSLTFSSIPASYDDLLFIGTLKGDSSSYYTPADNNNYVQLGHSSGTMWNAASNYNYSMLYDRYSDGTFLGYANNNASAGTSDKINAWPIPGSSNDTNNPAGYWFYLPAYRNTTNSVGKSFQLFSGAISNSTNAFQVVQLSAGTLPNTGTNNAIDTVTFNTGNGNFTTSSKMSMYGISNS